MYKKEERRFSKDMNNIFFLLILFGYFAWYFFHPIISTALVILVVLWKLCEHLIDKFQQFENTKIKLIKSYLDLGLMFKILEHLKFKNTNKLISLEEILLILIDYFNLTGMGIYKIDDELLTPLIKVGQYSHQDIQIIALNLSNIANNQRLQYISPNILGAKINNLNTKYVMTLVGPVDLSRIDLEILNKIMIILKRILLEQD